MAEGDHGQSYWMCRLRQRSARYPLVRYREPDARGSVRVRDGFRASTSTQTSVSFAVRPPRRDTSGVRDHPHDVHHEQGQPSNKLWRCIDACQAAPRSPLGHCPSKSITISKHSSTRTPRHLRQRTGQGAGDGPRPTGRGDRAAACRGHRDRQGSATTTDGPAAAVSTSRANRGRARRR